MKTSGLVLAAALAIAACSKKSDSTSAGGGDDRCAKAIDHGMELSKAMMPADDKVLAKLRATGIQRCTEDKWSADAVQCMIDAKAMADAQLCYGKLTDEQRTKMNRAAMDTK